jgi:hypothetical protein
VGFVSRWQCPLGLAVGIAAGLSASPAAAFDPFEIQVYDGTANPAGVTGLELHLNEWASGHHDSSPPELPLFRQFHATTELSLGILRFWEAGAYLQTAVRRDGTFDYAGAKLRSKFVTPPGWHPHWRLGVNVEAALLPQAYDRDRWSAELRPIVAWQNDSWLLAINPIVGQSLAGDGAADGPSFQPAAKAARTVGPVALGFEYFGLVGPIASPLPLGEQAHYLYEVVDLLSVEHVELSGGVGEGLTPASAGITLKLVVGYEFEHAERQPIRGQ